jgi:hypothetical protein
VYTTASAAPAIDWAYLPNTPVRIWPSTGNKRGHPKVTYVISKTTHKIDIFYWKRPIQSEATMPLQRQEEAKKQSELREVLRPTHYPALKEKKHER